MSLMQALTRLYQVDRQVRGLRSRLESAERYLTAQQKQLADAEHDRDELLVRKKHLQATIANLETEGGVIDAQLEKFRGDLNSASTNKQYTAVLTELNTVKAERSRLDDRILEHLTAIEEIDESITTAKERVIERTKLRDVAKAQLDQRQNDVGTRLEELQRDRDEAAEDVPGPQLAMFDHVAEQHDGEAMAPIEEIDRRRREYSCGACNLHLPFDQVAVLMGEVSSVVRCTACGRILFMQDEVRGALAGK